MNYDDLLKEFSLNNHQLLALKKYSELLVEWNEKFNLTAILEVKDIYLKHFYDCLLVAKNYNLHGSLIDVGTGAGFPGIILKIYQPDLCVTLLEPNSKKCIFLNEVIKTLNLENIEVINQRAEDLELREYYDFASARGVSQLNILLEIIAPLLKVNGHFLAMKGPKAKQEVLESANALELLSCQINDVKEFVYDDNQRSIIDITKTKVTSSKYPRHYSQIKKKPL